MLLERDRVGARGTGAWPLREQGSPPCGLDLGTGEDRHPERWGCVGGVHLVLFCGLLGKLPWKLG